MVPNQTPDTSAEDASRSLSRQMAADYDGLIYDPAPPGDCFAGRLFGIGSLYGCDAPMGDVLDLGCGTGGYLADIAADMTGRVVGIDLSVASVELARKRCAPFGDRARILHADLLDLTPSDLGQFDLICNVGVQYVVPVEVRRHLIRLMGECLRPGGVLFISYYVGPESSARIPIYRMLQSRDDRGASPKARLAAARVTLQALGKAAHGNRQQKLIEDIVASLSRLKGATLFHEIFNPLFEVFDTAGVARDLHPCGLRFLNFLQGSTFNGMPTSRERLSAASDLDVLASGYRYALFGKPKHGDAPFDMWTPGVRWRSGLVHRPEFSTEGRNIYTSPENKKFKVPSSVLDFVLRQMGEEPRTLAELCDAAAHRLPGIDLRDDGHRVAEVLRTLWGVGLLVPVRDP